MFTSFWPLGFIAFGGPAAHVAILRDHLVVQRDWVNEEQFLELFAIGQVRFFINVIISVISAANILFLLTIFMIVSHWTFRLNLSFRRAYLVRQVHSLLYLLHYRELDHLVVYWH